MSPRAEPTGLGGVAMLAAFCGVILAMGKAGGWVQRVTEERNEQADAGRRP